VQHRGNVGGGEFVEIGVRSSGGETSQRPQLLGLSVCDQPLPPGCGL
jgi:hypothetical protein